MAHAGFKGLMVNVGDHEPAQWDLIRARARENGMFCGPWLHTRGPDGMFSLERLERVISIAKAWESPVCVNSEKEIDGTGSTCTRIIAAAVQGLDAVISTEAWLYNPPSVDWTPLAEVPFALQIFPESGATDGSSFKAHAHECGIRCVGYTFASYGGRVPNDYRLDAPYSIYTADDIGQDHYHEWAPTSAGFRHCTDEEEEETMPQGAAASAYEAFDYWLNSTAKPDAWRASNPGEWEKIRAYRTSAPGTPPPAVTSSTGKMLVAIIDAARWGDGTHV